MPSNKGVVIEFDEATRSYYIVWKPVIISSGATREKALEDLKQAAHFCVDTFVGLELKDIPG